MGTWSAEVFGNDTSCEIKEYFYEQYNRGSEVTQIVSEIQEKFTYSLNHTDDRTMYYLRCPTAFGKRNP